MTAETIVSQFNPAALRDLERNHAVILDPFETSLAGLVTARRPFWYITNRNNPDFMGLLSRPSQVVFFPEPRQFYVPDSNRMSLVQQRRCLATDAAEVLNNRKRTGIGGVNWFIGNVATHAGLVFAYLDKTHGQVRLHGRDYGYKYARTETPTVGSLVADVGGFGADDGLLVHGWNTGDGDVDLWVVRLGAPAEE